MITASQLLAHAVGDYLVQSSWMATQKTSRWFVAVVHALSYSFIFLLFSPSLAAWTLIFLSHAIIDHYRIARYVIWLKDRLFAPQMSEEKFKEFTFFGYPQETPIVLSTWLFIITDNILHVLINGFALKYL